MANWWSKSRYGFQFQIMFWLTMSELLLCKAESCVCSSFSKFSHNCSAWDFLRSWMLQAKRADTICFGTTVILEKSLSLARSSCDCPSALLPFWSSSTCFCVANKAASPVSLLEPKTLRPWFEVWILISWGWVLALAAAAAAAAAAAELALELGALPVSSAIVLFTTLVCLEIRSIDSEARLA